MRFLSIYKTKERNTPPSQEEMDRMGKLVEGGFKSGQLLATEGCLPTARRSCFGETNDVRGHRDGVGAGDAHYAQSSTASRCGDNGAVTVTDGPFSEAKEVVGGFAIISANSKAEAIEYVREFLSVVGAGECELRQVYEAGTASCMEHAAKAQA